ncbi:MULTISPECIES: BolA family protein [Saccharibacter]|uniref:BolA-like protein n=1 Tax=Saccharibacter floricola DSM 15669 TaxID=1123227 RepID=A0ABQ0P0G5_9PROT|nr:MULTISPECIES: BolA family transcriptional regulator [Saccharibacter]MXV36322.1 BolA/IbaG family iron-sulfur metabolism protein [Saccharibacter sp. EH611]MXV57181.1 BolA/IbaG family iron-sulfur metabolism protein [Saccharibacter sp. EH70]MXV66459.1 BolA/IbaG family iron-sulfur metabolism protein [Saccharibacter sp. EH60]GBQ07800.1 BolA-like protein [Saccharibacter floricola DSM 15669]
MPMPATEIERTIRDAFPDAQITVQDLAGDGDHYACEVVSEAFRGVPRVKQHQMVYAAFGGRVGTELHALAVKTRTPE